MELTLLLVLPAIIVCEAVDLTIGAESDAVWFVLLLIPSLSVMAGLSFTPASTGYTANKPVKYSAVITPLGAKFAS